jgi:hypothetical protein
MQHIPLAIICLGINQAQPERYRTILKIQINKSISATEGILCGTESARCVDFCAASWWQVNLRAATIPPRCPQRDFPIGDAVATPVGYGKHRFTPANFS